MPSSKCNRPGPIRSSPSPVADMIKWLTINQLTHRRDGNNWCVISCRILSSFRSPSIKGHRGTSAFLAATPVRIKVSCMCSEVPEFGQGDVSPTAPSGALVFVAACIGVCGMRGVISHQEGHKTVQILACNKSHIRFDRHAFPYGDCEQSGTFTIRSMAEMFMQIIDVSNPGQ